RDHVDPDARGAAPGPRQFQTEDDAERAIEPPAVGHAVAVRPDKDALLCVRRASVDGADTVDNGFEAGGHHLVYEPAASVEIGVAESRAADASPLLAEFGQGPKVSKNAILVDGKHPIARSGMHREYNDAKFTL